MKIFKLLTNHGLWQSELGQRPVAASRPYPILPGVPGPRTLLSLKSIWEGSKYLKFFLKKKKLNLEELEFLQRAPANRQFTCEFASSISQLDCPLSSAPGGFPLAIQSIPRALSLQRNKAGA